MAKKGLWDNIHAKRERGESPAKPGQEGYPKTLDIMEYGGKIHVYDAGGRTELKGIDLSDLDKKDIKLLHKHSDHHTKEHVEHMVDKIEEGETFTQSHTSAMKKTGK